MSPRQEPDSNRMALELVLRVGNTKMSKKAYEHYPKEKIQHPKCIMKLYDQIKIVRM
jgi:hypothetical protein